jgi:orotate phosphoribosyltransferase
VTRAELAALVARHALLEGDFLLRSGRRSRHYLDKYRFETDPALLGPLSEALEELAQEVQPDADRLAGPELGAVPLVTALALRTGQPFVIVRGAAKAYGTGNRLEGPSSAGERVLLVEDVVTSGGAALGAVEALRAAGLEVDNALCVLDREEGGAAALAAAGVELHPLFDRAAIGLPAPPDAPETA